jgi:hypothetical protein
MKSIIQCLFLVLFFSCKDDKSEEAFTSKPSENAIEIKHRIEEIETLSFRRTYVGHENLSDQALEELHKSNPSLTTYKSDSKIFKKLNQLNILEDADLVLSKFEGKKLEKQYLDVFKKIEVTCNYDGLFDTKIELSVKNGISKTSKIIDFKEDHIIGMLVTDIDDDDIREILIVTNYYIMNGDNFLLSIFKYK